LAQMAAGSNITIMRIKEFLGLNENQDGDTKIRVGEMSEMRNFSITKDSHLQIRPGTHTLLHLRTAWDAWAEDQESPVEAPVFCGAWYGMVNKAYHLLCAFGGAIFDVNILTEAVTAVGACTQDETTTFFGFDEKVYLLNGHEYMSWGAGEDETFSEVEGYVPVIQTATEPGGSGTLLENVNRLTGKRRVKFSPDGTAKDFFLPEKEIDSVISVTGTEATYTVDTAAGKMTFATAPEKGTNTVTVTYKKGDGARAEVTSMHFSELYNGSLDSRVFLYGDGSNKTIYSGIDGDTGLATAEYFPDLYEAAIGDSNTPITALVRHYARLMAFKRDSAWSLQYSTTVLDNGITTPAFYVLPVNRQIGNDAPGQVRLLENNPLTLDGGSIYQWRSTSSSGNITDSEQNATRISDRIAATLREFDLEKTKTFNRKYHHEYWFLWKETALILNYSNNTWYTYTNMPFVSMLEVDQRTFGFTQEGKIKEVSRSYRNDDGEEISAYAATGAMDFDRDWQLKYSPVIFVAIKPENNARITVTAESNRRSDYPDKVVAASFASFTNVDFNHWSFLTNRKPQVERLKLKVKKATFYRLIFKSDSASATATVLETDVQLRYAGNVK
jgi:hypothetical protein